MKATRVLSPVLLSILCAACGPVARGGSSRGGGGNVNMDACRVDFGTTSAAAKLETFFDATARFHESAFAAQSELLAACQRTGRALGMSEAELSSDLATVCAAANERLRTEMAAIRSSTTVSIATEPPHCEISVEAYGSCMATCEGQLDPGSVEVTCEGGEIRGQCDASCQGSCAVDVSGICGGTCEGMCSGTCGAPTSSGACAGSCDGTCQGRCVVSAEASCQGECRGGCSVAYREPYCTGRLRRPTASARCRAACDARIETQAHCTPGRADVSVEGGLDEENQARLLRVQLAMREGVSAILALRERITRLRDAGAEIVETAPSIPGAAAAVSIGAVACASAAALSCAESAASLSVSVEVTVSFSASVQG